MIIPGVLDDGLAVDVDSDSEVVSLAVVGSTKKYLNQKHHQWRILG